MEGKGVVDKQREETKVYSIIRRSMVLGVTNSVFKNCGFFKASEAPPNRNLKHDQTVTVLQRVAWRAGLYQAAPWILG